MAASQSNTIDVSPQVGQSISHDGESYTTIREGLAHILVPHGIPTSTDPRMSKEETQKQQVFYNPIQQFNRDLSVLAIKTFGADTMVRKQEKHSRGTKKADKSQRGRANAGNGKPYPVLPDTDNSNSKKRKLDHDEVESNDAIAGKRHKGIHDGDTVPFLEAEAAPSSAAQARPPDVAAENRPEWKPQFTILDALSATGLRALRYAQEIPFSTSITANDMSAKATASISLNVRHNQLEDKITPTTGNAIAHMYSFVDKKGYDVIDLDPYGTAAPFLDAAIQAISDDGLLCVTCTDSAIFASHGYLEKTYSQYGGLPLKGEPCHEGGLRLILHAIASSAARYGLAIEPLLSLSIDYYIRVFVRVRRSPNDVKLLAGKTMIVYHCQNGCGAWTTQFLARNKTQNDKNGKPFSKHSFAQGPSASEHCEHCGSKTHLSGPMYGGLLHNVDFIERVLAQLKEVDRETYPTMDRIKGMLHTALEEVTFGAKPDIDKTKESTQLGPLIPKADPAEVDHHPFFLIPSSISRTIHCSAPSLAALRGALRHAGFRVAMSHCKPGSIKTDASWKDIWHIMLEWVRQKAPLKNQPKTGTAGYAIIAKEVVHEPKAAADEDATGMDEIADADKTESRANGSAGGESKTSDNSSSYLGVDFKVKFDEYLGRDHDRGRYVRYQLAPRENWGPMSRAK